MGCCGGGGGGGGGGGVSCILGVGWAGCDPGRANTAGHRSTTLCVYMNHGSPSSTGLSQTGYIRKVDLCGSILKESV